MRTSLIQEFKPDFFGRTLDDGGGLFPKDNIDVKVDESSKGCGKAFSTDAPRFHENLKNNIK
ncbi:MAG: hypothetical protein AAB696_01900 [Patescibacteria group bacterium]